MLIDKYKKGRYKACNFMNMHTFHKSGKNYSNKFRLIVAHDNSKGDFRPFYDTGKYNYSKIKKFRFKFFLNIGIFISRFF